MSVLLTRDKVAEIHARYSGIKYYPPFIVPTDEAIAKEQIRMVVELLMVGRRWDEVTGSTPIPAGVCITEEVLQALLKEVEK